VGQNKPPKWAKPGCQTHRDGDEGNMAEIEAQYLLVNNPWSGSPLPSCPQPYGTTARLFSWIKEMVAQYAPVSATGPKIAKYQDARCASPRKRRIRSFRTVPSTGGNPDRTHNQRRLPFTPDCWAATEWGTGAVRLGRVRTIARLASERIGERHRSKNGSDDDDGTDSRGQKRSKDKYQSTTDPMCGLTSTPNRCVHRQRR
jgi:hypothetical protein